MPSPRPIRRQFARSSGVPCARRGYQSNGTLTVRPSTRSTTSASSVTVTCWANAARNSLCEVLIPRPTELNCVVPHQRLHAPDLGPAKTAALRQPHRVEPEFGTARFPLHMHVPWFVSVSGIEEQPIWPCPEDRRHRDDCMPKSWARGLAVSLIPRPRHRAPVPLPIFWTRAGRGRLVPRSSSLTRNSHEHGGLGPSGGLRGPRVAARLRYRPTLPGVVSDF